MTNRNSNARFDLAPQVEIERSTFDRSFNVKTSFDVGELVPFYCDEILPGDSCQIQTSKVARLQTLISPVMDNLYLDTYYFFVPNRLVWEHWQEFCGENKTSAWIPQVEYEVPSIYPPSGGWNVGTIADYFGIPTGVEDGDLEGINALPFRAYALICNEWFRDQNLQRPIPIPTNDTAVAGKNSSSYLDVAYGGKPFVACKYHDYFTSCLPAPQKSADAALLNGYAPVLTYNSDLVSGTHTPLRFKRDNGTSNIGVHNLYAASNILAANGDTFTPTETGNQYLYPSNLYADLSQMKDYSSDISGALTNMAPFTINSLRQAFQIQRLYEKDARGGTRYIEILRSHFGVTSPDARLQRPEYLGGSRTPFNIEQVIQTSSTDATTPQGNVAGWSQTNEISQDVNKSFVEHGYIIGLMCARYDHTYQGGLERMWTRKERFDFYWPALAHLGEQAVYESEICWDGEGYRRAVFGYQEAWAEYRYKPNFVTGMMRSSSNNGLDYWHFADYYGDDVPSLSADWIVEDKSNVDRCLAVQSGTASQIFADVYVQNKFTRPMPMYSIPGLIDHF